MHNPVPTVPPDPASSGATHGWLARVREVFGCDLRSLAALRIGLGVAVLADVVSRARDLGALYTEAGFLPAGALLTLEGPLVQFSAHYWASASPLLTALLFAATGLCAVALMAGFHTRVATAACWYLVASIQIRQPLAYMGGDSLLRLLLFWSLFLPTAARFSRDAAAGRVRVRPDRLVSVGTVAILLQVCLMYWATGLRKGGSLWWTGRAINYALGLEFATPFGEWLRQQQGILPSLTYGTLWLELLGPCLAFIPLGNPWWRLATIALFWLFHVGLATAMNIGLFPLFSMVGWLAFLPTAFWTWCGSTTRGGAAPPPTPLSRVASVTAATCLLYVVLLLAERAHVIPSVLPQVALQAGKALRLQQSWNMFAPDPRTRRSRQVLQVERGNGEMVEVEAGSTFRRKRFVWSVALDAGRNATLATVAERVATDGCRVPDARRTTLISRTTPLLDGGQTGDTTTHLVARVECDNARMQGGS